MERVEQLAKVFSEIHNYSYVPFYDEIEVDFWDRLPESSSNPTEQLSKDFFRKMSTYVTELLKSEKNKQERLAKILYEIHAGCLVPFYKSQEIFDRYKNDHEDYWYEHTWDKLEDDLINKEVVDKKFFLDIARHLIEEAKLY
jgi:transglutaminase-like putative cysteine protease